MLLINHVAECIREWQRGEEGLGPIVFLEVNRSATINDEHSFKYNKNNMAIQCTSRSLNLFDTLGLTQF